MKDIMIKIISRQTLPGDDPLDMEFTTEATCDVVDGKYVVVYNESELSGMDGCQVTLEIQDTFVRMTRMGDSQSTLEYTKGDRYASDYVTPYGNFKIEIRTKELDWTMDESGKGRLYLKYDMMMQSVVESLNEITFEISPAE